MHKYPNRTVKAISYTPHWRESQRAGSVVAVKTLSGSHRRLRAISIAHAAAVLQLAPRVRL